MRDSLHESQSGHALVELALVAFVLFLIAFWSVEISRVLRFQQIATALSRELSSVVYRECVADNAAFPPNRADAPVSRFDPRTCIPDILTREFIPRMNRIAPGAVITLSYFGFSAGAVSRDYIWPPTATTRFTLAMMQNEVAANTDMGKALSNFGVLVVGEVRLPNNNLGFGTGRFASHFTDWLYAVTVL